MGLVDYSSSSSDDEAQPDSALSQQGASNQTSSKMPPLPSTFHDLYASTVRQSMSDDPSLHQGRKRQNPHIVGNWPTHLYIEWHPSKVQHDLLDALVRKSQHHIGQDVHLHNFLTSDLGTELPLHISLSKPLSLSTSIKDSYLARVENTIQTSGLLPFSVRPAGLAWYRSPDSDRTFFVLRVVSSVPIVAGGSDDKKQLPQASINPELMKLLIRCNQVAAHFQQPPLYQQTPSEKADLAFHVSIGWTMGTLDEETCLLVLKNFKGDQFQSIRKWKIDIDGVKAKIGNVVSHIPLKSSGKGSQDGEGSATSLFGL